MVRVKASAIIHDSQVEPGVFEPQFDANCRAIAMTNNVIQGFLEDEQHIAAYVSSEPQIRVWIRRLELVFYLPAREDFAGKPSHAVDQICQMIALRVDSPDYVSHRSDRLARDLSD